MAKRTMVYKTLHRKFKIEQHEPHTKKNENELRYSGRVGTSFSTTDIRLYTVKIATLPFPFRPKVKVRGDNYQFECLTVTTMTCLTITEYLCHK